MFPEPSAGVADAVTCARKFFSAATSLIQHHHAAGCSQYRQFGPIPALTCAAAQQCKSVMPARSGPLQDVVAIGPTGRHRSAEQSVEYAPDEPGRRRVGRWRGRQPHRQVEVVAGCLDRQRRDEVRGTQHVPLGSDE